MDYKIAEQDIKNILSNNKEEDIVIKIVDYLYQRFEEYSWVGIYMLKDGYLILGPWRGEQATEHTKIPVGKGICGSAAKSGETEIVSDVKSDDRYLSCFISTKSEIVVPIKKNSKIIGEIDIDSDKKGAFNKDDKVFLEKIADMLKEHI